MLIEGKIAVITGASRGLGYACADRFVRDGAKVILADVQDDLGEHAAEKLRAAGGDAQYMHCDVTQKSDVQKLIDFAVETHLSLIHI